MRLVPEQNATSPQVQSSGFTTGPKPHSFTPPQKPAHGAPHCGVCVQP
jgi:hypothetical protein